MTEKFTIAKLTGSDNYASWAADLCIVLKHHRHWSWIEGVNAHPPPRFIKSSSTPLPSTSVEPAITASGDGDDENPAYTIWEDGANDALYHIMMTCESNVKDQIRKISIPSVVWKKLKNLYEPSNASTQFDYLSTIWNLSLDDYPSVTSYCSALEVAASNYLASGPTDFDHMIALIALMGLPSSYKVTQRNILSKAGPVSLLLDSIKGDLLNEERMLARETKQAEKVANTLQAQKSHKPENGNQTRWKPKTPEEKAQYDAWLKAAVCHYCKQTGHIEVFCPMKLSKKGHVNQVTSPTETVEDDIQSESEVELEAMLAYASLDGHATAYVTSPELPQTRSWVIDSGCSHHMTPILDGYISYTHYSSPHSVHLANKSSIEALGEGTVKIVTIVAGEKHDIHLQRTLHVPVLANSLLSVKTLNRRGYSAFFLPKVCSIYNPKGVAIAKSEQGGSLFKLHTSPCDPHPMASTAHIPTQMTLDLLHKHLGHPSSATLQRMIWKGLV